MSKTRVPKYWSLFARQASKNKTLIIVGAFTSTAMFVRFYGLTTQSYWIDELASIDAANPERSVNEVLSRTFENDVTPPLFNLLLWCFVRIFGFNEASGRALPAIFGTLLIPAVYYLGKQVSGRAVGIYASAILIFNVYSIAYSQEVRSYSLYLFAATLSFAFFLRLLRWGEPRVFVVYLGSTIAMIYSHYYGLLLLFSQFLVYLGWLSHRSSPERKYVAYGMSTALAVMIALILMYPAVLADLGKKEFWIDRSGAEVVVESIYDYFGNSSMYVSVISTFAAIGLARLGYDSWNARRWDSFSLVSSSIVTSYTVPIVLGMIWIPVILPRYTSFVLVLIALLAANGIIGLRSRVLRGLALVVCVGLSAYNLVYEREYFEKIDKEQYRELLLFVAKHSNRHPIVAVKDAEYYKTYSRMLGLAIDIEDIESLEFRMAVGQGYRCFWMIDAHRKLMATEFLQRHEYRVLESHEFYKSLAILVGERGIPRQECDARSRDTKNA